MADVTKSGLVQAIAEKTKLSKADTERMLNAAVETIGEELKRGKSVQNHGVRHIRAARAEGPQGPQPPDGRGSEGAPHARSGIQGWQETEGHGKIALSAGLDRSARGRGVAQFGSAFDWGSKGRRFKSGRPDQPSSEAPQAGLCSNGTICVAQACWHKLNHGT